MSKQQKESLKMIVLLVGIIIISICGMWLISQYIQNLYNEVIDVEIAGKKVTDLKSSVDKAYARKLQLQVAGYTLYDIGCSQDYKSFFIAPIQKGTEDLKGLSFIWDDSGLVEAVIGQSSQFRRLIAINSINSSIEGMYKNRFDDLLQQLNTVLNKAENKKISYIRSEQVNVENLNGTLNIVALLVILSVIITSVIVAYKLNKQIIKDNLLTKAVAESRNEIEVFEKIYQNNIIGVLPSNEELSKNPHYDIYGYLQSLEAVGGDYYDIFTVGEYMYIVAADVAGHDIPSAMMAIPMKCSALISASISGEMSPRELLIAVNKYVASVTPKKGINGEKPLVSTFLVVKIHVETGYGEYMGHHPNMMIYRDYGNDVEMLEANEEPLDIGLFGDIAYRSIIAKCKTYNFQLSKADKLIIYTDGFTELPVGETYTKEVTLKDGSKVEREIENFLNSDGLAKLIRENGWRTSQKLVKSITDYTDKFESTDDMTLLSVGKR